MSDVMVELRGAAGLITLNRPRALNALSLDMIRSLTAALLAWRDDDEVKLVAIRGMGKEGPFGAFCAGGDIRFFHQAVLAGDPRLEDFFTEEYALNHLIHRFPKPYVVFLDGVVMGGGMGISGHGNPNSMRIVTERTRMAMPETLIGLFPDVGGGWFLGRCPGRVGEYLALTGHALGGDDACAALLADGVVNSAELESIWTELAAGGLAALPGVRERLGAPMGETPHLGPHREQIDRIFGLHSVAAILRALEAEPDGVWVSQTANALRKASPLMLNVTLEQVRRARGLTLADELRMERGIVRRCFQLRPGTASETMEGIRAMAIDKDHEPRWNPETAEEVVTEMVGAYFDSPWPAHAHPLRHLD
ncbi:enoyl-CoA hydratase/isomerase family protein [Caenimonas sedimenti]|uniref:Enoyl-CoA hydratase/isomerase family protein n=1 Tax=Caenimonas sedimenti TaxID=2596921 RepID=A0A562ZTX2_9BURK|nr:enoyl-CoA hydratase/isomerase family protein [Caenimonas sedimenti]TWO71831.1 enoyl-CoA hydratase/isomerase family protein [Caenimonas sedimenti]